MTQRRARQIDREGAESLAIAALRHIAGDPESLGRFLATTGLGPETLRAAAAEPGFLASVLDHLAADEAALLAFASNQDVHPETVSAARAVLGGAAGWPVGHGG